MGKRTIAEVENEALQNLELLIKEYNVDIIIDSPDEIQQRLGIDTPVWRSSRNKLVELGRIALIANPKSGAYPAVRILKNEMDEVINLKESGWHKCYFKGPNGEKVTEYHNKHDLDVPCVRALPEDAFPPFKKGFNTSTLTSPGTPIKSGSTGISGGAKGTPESATPPTSNTNESLNKMWEEQRKQREAEQANFKILGKVFKELPNGDIVEFYLGNDDSLWLPHPEKEGKLKRITTNDSAGMDKYWKSIRKPMTAAIRQDLGLTKKKTFNTAEPAQTYKERHLQEAVIEEFWFNPATRAYYDDYGVLQGKDHQVWQYVLLFVPTVVMYCITAMRVRWDAWYSEYKEDMDRRNQISRNLKVNKRVREAEVKELKKKGRRHYGDEYAYLPEARPVRRVNAPSK